MANKTPLLRPLRQTGSTLYVFPSASEDIGLNINSGTSGVAMSHYALLNFTKKNFTYTDPEKIVESLQNYVMNFETVVMNQPAYSYQEPYTVSEHIFWNWLVSKGLEINTGSPVTGNVFREKNYKSGQTADRLVQCFGSIDAGNSLSTDFGMFNETYVTVPTSYGNGPVFFRQVTDNPNYQTGVSYYPENMNMLEGRDGTVSGYVDTAPIYDENGTYIDHNAFEIVKDFPTIQKALRSLSSDNDIKNSININSFDDLNVDADNVLHYLDNGSYDMVNVSCEFNFNAILLYYSVYDMDDVNKEPVATNLFGIVFLDGGASQTPEYLLAPLKKKKSYTGNGQSNAYFGNAFSFRVNIKTLSVYDNTDAVIQDNTTTTSSYSQDFNDVVYNLNRAIDVMNVNVQTTQRIQNEYMKMLDYYSETRENMKQMKNDVSTMVSDRLRNTEDRLKSYVDSELDNAVEELNGERTYVSILSGSSVDVYAPENMQVLTKNVVYKLSDMTETHPDGVYVSDMVYDIDTLKEDVNELKESFSILSTGVESLNPVSLYGAVKQEPVSLDSELESLGIVKCIEILSSKKKLTEDNAPGLYLKKNKDGDITTVLSWDGNESSSVKCVYGKLYSVQSLLYVWNGKTLKLLGSPDETK